MPFPERYIALTPCEYPNKTTVYEDCETSGWANVCLVLVSRTYSSGEAEESIELYQIDQDGFGELTSDYRLVPRAFAAEN